MIFTSIGTFDIVPGIDCLPNLGGIISTKFHVVINKPKTFVDGGFHSIDLSDVSLLNFCQHCGHYY